MYKTLLIMGYSFHINWFSRRISERTINSINVKFISGELEVQHSTWVDFKLDKAACKYGVDHLQPALCNPLQILRKWIHKLHIQ